MESWETGKTYLSFGHGGLYRAAPSRTLLVKSASLLLTYPAWNEESEDLPNKS